jgi:hypothetical protein
VQGDDDGGGHLHIVSTIELRGKKINKTKFVVALGSRQSTTQLNNQQQQNVIPHEGECSRTYDWWGV